MTKAELVEIISEETGVNKKDTGLIVNLIMENIGQALINGDKVELRGFGSFKVKTRQARLARNPRTGADVQVEAKQVPFFKASNDLKARLNEKNGWQAKSLLSKRLSVLILTSRLTDAGSSGSFASVCPARIQIRSITVLIGKAGRYA